MLHNHTGYILTPEAVAKLMIALTRIRKKKLDDAVITVRGRTGGASKIVAFEARLKSSGVVTLA
jgi:predicted nucleic-acid-binding protein